MKTHGMKPLDPLLETSQMEWLVVNVRECPDQAAERRIIGTYFRKVHDVWGPVRAFVRPVQVRRSRRRVLFCQESGLAQ
jgi:hypothetical protein